MEAKGIKDYLAQEGIWVESLKQGKKILFVDTGFSGTISKKIQSYFPAKYSSRLVTHLLASSVPEHPRSRVFLSWFNQELANIKPFGLYGMILNYEFIPHYTNRSSHFEKKDFRWNAMSTANVSHFFEQDGIISKEKAKQYMEDLLYFNQVGDAKELYNHRSEIWRKLYKFSQGKNKKKLIDQLQLLLEEMGSRGESIVRDFIEIVERNNIMPKRSRPSLRDVRLEYTSSHYKYTK